MYNHIKTPYSLETNCISLSSNANVARTYGETFSDKYVMIKVPKKEMGQRVYNAGQYMLAEIDKKVQERIAQGNIPEEVLEDFRRIDETTESKELKEIIKVKYTAPDGIDTSKSGMKKGIIYKAPLARVSSFQALDDEQTLEKNKIVAKLTILEQKGLIKIQTVPEYSTHNAHMFYIKARSLDERTRLIKYLKEKDIAKFKGLLGELFLTAVSYYDVSEQEKYYHNLMLGFSFGLESMYIIKSNREYGTGRVDLLLKSKDGKLPNYIFEFKVSKKREDLETDCKKALAQIEENRYGIELENPVKIGMSFYGKELEILVKE
jgi:hypothetical protein